MSWTLSCLGCWASPRPALGGGTRERERPQESLVREMGKPYPQQGYSPQDGDPQRRERRTENAAGLPESQLSPEQLYMGRNDGRPGKHHSRARELTGPGLTQEPPRAVGTSRGRSLLSHGHLLEP